MSTQPESAHGSNQGQTLDKSPKETPNQPHQEPTLEKAFVKAIDSIVKANMPSKVKLQEPDPFDSSNSHKLHTFILQCKLNFWDCPDLFKDDSTKVNYILSYLKGSALDCFEPGLLDPMEPAWLSDFALFIQELEDNFGSYDPVSEAEAELEGLGMQENHQAMKYFIKFMQLTTRVHWGEAALQHQAYNGLAKHIKNNMVHHDKPTSLSGLQKLSQAIDACYWERHVEVSHEIAISGTSGNKSESKSEKSDPKSNKGSSQSKQKNMSSGSSQSKRSSTEAKKMNPDLSSKLGKDGKLMPQE